MLGYEPAKMGYEVRFWLINVRDAAPAVAEHLDQNPDLGELAGVALRYMAVSRELLRFAVLVGGRLSPN